MKTKLKEVLPMYLGQLCTIGDSNAKHPICIVAEQSVCTGTNKNNIQNWFKISACKPILYPLSSIRENIDNIMIRYFFNMDKDGVQRELELIGSGIYNVQCCSFRVGLALIKDGYDIFGLIESGQAIDKTTLKP